MDQDTVWDAQSLRVQGTCITRGVDAPTRMSTFADLWPIEKQRQAKDFWACVKGELSKNG